MTDSIVDLVLNEFPRKEARAPGRKAVVKALKAVQKEEGCCLLEAVETLLRATVLFRKHWEYLISSGKKEKDFIPMPATFYNQERYRDTASWEMPPVEKSSIPSMEWVAENWKPILQQYNIQWADRRYWNPQSWPATWDSLPAAVRADLKALMQ